MKLYRGCKIPRIGSLNIQNLKYCYKLNIYSNCWEWIGSKNSKGYGRKWDSNRKRCWTAHRLVYELFHGQLKSSKIQVCHTCDNPPCVNPDHLFLGTNQDNQIDSRNKGRLSNRKGSKHPGHILTEKQVRRIKKVLQSDKTMKNRDLLAQQYDISLATITSISDNRNWGWL